jgi:hypothetical protein
MKKIHFRKIIVIGLLSLLIAVSFGASFEPLSCDANGPYEGNIMDDIEFEGTATGGTPPYEFSWDYGDGNTSSGDPHPTHNYANAGIYTVILNVTDSENNTASDSTFTFINAPPNPPNIDGPDSGKIKTEYDFTFNSVDPEGHNVKYIIYWGDNSGNQTDFNPSGTDVEVSHTWSEPGSFACTVYAMDEYEAVGEKTHFTMTIQKSKEISTHFQSLFNFLKSHPNLFPIIRQILGLY